MRHEARGDMVKVWLYAAASVGLGAWLAPMLYNAGKALAEVSVSKTTNGLIEWLAVRCGAAGFAEFQVVGMILAAALLFLPWMEWIHAKRGEVSGTGPWKFRLPGGARTTDLGQALKRNIEGPWHACSGFMVVTGLVLSLGVALVPAGYFTMRHPGSAMIPLVATTLAWALAGAVLMEIAFRGIAMGIFLRAMRPAAALGMSAVFFAVLLSLVPERNALAGDPEDAAAGFRLLGEMALRFADWRHVFGSFAPLLALGAVLAFARWRTASLWLPVGLHTGWRFAKGLLDELSSPVSGNAGGELFLNGVLLQQGIVPLAAIVVAGMLARHLLGDQRDESALRP
jgi:uncharacterized protein